MSKFILAGLAAAVLLGCATPTAAQTPAPGAAETTDQAVKRTLVRRYLDALQLEKLMNSMMESMMAPLMADSSIPADKLPIVREAFLEAFGVVMPQMMEMNVDLYVETFTVEELEQLVAFYESAVGRSVMAKTLTLSRQSGEIMARATPILEAEMQRQLCARIECPAAPPVVVVPSAGARATP